jgi:hypothetical protein
MSEQEKQISAIVTVFRHGKDYLLSSIDSQDVAGDPNRRERIIGLEEKDGQWLQLTESVLGWISGGIEFEDAQ